MVWNNVRYDFQLASTHALVCMCARVRAHSNSYFQTAMIYKQLEISSLNLVQQWSSHAPLIVTIFMRIDAQSKIAWYFEFFEKSLR